MPPRSGQSERWRYVTRRDQRPLACDGRKTAPMKVFVTGGSGYLGRAAIKALTRRNIQVSALVRSEKSAATVAALGAEPVRGTLTDTGILTGAARAADGVIHLGQHAGPDSGDVDRAAAQALQTAPARTRMSTPAEPGSTATPTASWTRKRRSTRPA
ncbi:NAD(P)H-binding protein [Actinacidiphila glaucinigra]|uniref:NAD(P)H-binding protein n=1 Tax=Actinacidiphila glaucinigra TaxID=235986 RepID=UPI00371C69A2